MIYQAPDIKDRIAVGDDLYTITDSGGKKKLTPNPTEVTEPGTPIDRTLLQPMADALERIDIGSVPYTQYWWRRRGVAGGYIEVRQTAWEAGVGYHYTSAVTGIEYRHLSVKRYYGGSNAWDLATLQYSSSITIDQTNGAVILNNPSTYAFTEDTDVSSEAIYARFQGKFVKGFIGGDSDRVIYIPLGMDMTSRSWGDFNEYTIEYGYELNDEYNPYMPIVINTTQNTQTGQWESISSDEQSTYPESGESGGYEWCYCGRISDFAPSLYPLGIKTINLTSASWNSGSYTLNLPCRRYLLWSNKTVSSRYQGVFLLVDNGRAYGYYNSGNSSYPIAPAIGESSVSDVSATFDFSQTGIVLSGSGALTLAYLPL